MLAAGALQLAQTSVTNVSEACRGRHASALSTAESCVDRLMCERWRKQVGAETIARVSAVEVARSLRAGYRCPRTSNTRRTLIVVR